MADKTLKTDTLKTIALRGVVLFPGVTQHFDVGRPRSVYALEAALAAEEPLFAVCQKDPDIDDPDEKSLYDMGCVIEVKQVMPMPDGTLRVLVNPLCRAKAEGVVNTGEMIVSKIKRITEKRPSDKDSRSVLAQSKELFRAYQEEKGDAGGENAQLLLAMNDIGEFCDRFAATEMENFVSQQQVLSCVDVLERAGIACRYMYESQQFLSLRKEIQKRTHERLDKNNREYFLREQQRLIDEELGDDEDDIAGYEKKLEALPMNEEAKERTAKEIKRLKRVSPQSPEGAVMENYIEYMLELPWGKYTKDKLSVSRAKRVLDEDHYALTEVKKRVLEFLAVRSVKNDPKSPILCLVGAPGVGKTSIARSVARALGREFCQVSLGGVHDEAELRGHRRTYVAAMPGRVISAIKQVGSMNPVFLFDEIDKMASDMRGDPAAAMLEVLDPEQNARFRDHYLEAPFDLSRVLFITTANSVEAIPKPLFDRMEVIEVPSYTLEEKIQIAKRHLWKKCLSENGLGKDELKITVPALKTLIEGYTREAGVRNLERALARLCRKAVVEKLEKREKWNGITFTPETIPEYLGAPDFLKRDAAKKPEVGTVNGLAWTSAGGEVMPIEVSVMPGSGQMELTGSLGNVMKESAHIAMSFVRQHMQEDGVTEEFRKTHDIHVHVPEGATPKDGPSAGIAMACAIYSAMTGLEARQDVAMTGELSLRGNALPIGGVKEKLLAAYRLGINNILLPRENVKDLEDIPLDVRGKMNVMPITRATEALKYVLPGKRV
ncbi:MAG: endopeptidase La [Clostridiales bacterium]|nr:endopeptidase La [Clostridiales bacterium]